jgi:hypothetical protein
MQVDRVSAWIVHEDIAVEEGLPVADRGEKSE